MDKISIIVSDFQIFKFLNKKHFIFIYFIQEQYEKTPIFLK